MHLKHNFLPLAINLTDPQ